MMARVRSVTLMLLAVFTAVGASAAFSGLAPSAAQAAEKGDIIERIIAVVNGEALLLSELRQRAAPFLPRLLQAPELQRMTLMTQLYDELLTQIIDERLLEQESRKLSVSVTSADVDRAIDNVKRQSGLDGPAFWDAVRAQGFEEDQYKGDVRRQLLRLKVVNQKVRSRINITEDDVRRKYDQTLRAARRTGTFLVSHVFMAVEAGSATNLAQVKAEADALRASLTPDSFDAAIEKVGGGDLGWVQQQDLPEALATALLDLEPKQISQPVRGPAGIHIFHLRERKEGGAAVPSFESAKNDLYRSMVDQAMAKQEVAFLEELRKQSLISRRL